MSVLIKNIEIPSKCIECRLMRRCGKDDLDYIYMPTRVYVEDLTNAYKPRPEYCPLVPVPPHGRLIDADAVERNLVKMQMAQKSVVGHGIRKSRAVVRDMATIIPADESNMDSFIHIFKEDDEEDGMDSFIQIFKD